MMAIQENAIGTEQPNRVKLIRNNNQYDTPSIRHMRSNKSEENISLKLRTTGKGGMYTDNDCEIDTQINLTNINTVREEWADWTDGIDQTDIEMKQDNDNLASDNTKDWRFIHTLSPSIRVDEDDNGSLLFRRGDYGLMITKEEVVKCLNMVMQSKTIEEINESIEVQALYNSNIEESSSKGSGKVV
jgi:hypothetical protein